MKKKKADFKIQIAFGAVILLMIIGVFVAYSINERTNNILVFYHWWTSPGESAALNKVIDIFSEKYPDVTVIPTSLTGGAGFAMLDVIRPVVAAGEAPDAFQVHAGYEAKAYFNEGLLEPINDIWESEKLEQVIPKVVQVMCNFEGNYYSVPMNIHRSNLIWYNKKLLDENDIDASELTTWDKFFEACDKLKKGGIDYPVQIGISWTVSHVFETIIASEGIDFYEDWVNGKVTSADDPRLLNALETFDKYLDYVNPDSANAGWDVTQRIIDEEGAFDFIGDWANGEFKAAGKVYGKDYGMFKVPGTENMFGLVIDTFQQPRNIKHPKNSDRWLKVIVSKEGQEAFNPLKGSISTRIDTNISKYDLYSHSAVLDFASLKYMYPSVVHGSGAPEPFRLKLNGIIDDFMNDRDVAKTAKEMTDYTKSISAEYSIEWELD